MKKLLQTCHSVLFFSGATASWGLKLTSNHEPHQSLEIQEKPNKQRKINLLTILKNVKVGRQWREWSPDLQLTSQENDKKCLITVRC